MSSFKKRLYNEGLSFMQIVAHLPVYDCIIMFLK